MSSYIIQVLVKYLKLSVLTSGSLPCQKMCQPTLRYVKRVHALNNRQVHAAGSSSSKTCLKNQNYRILLMQTLLVYGLLSIMKAKNMYCMLRPLSINLLVYLKYVALKIGLCLNLHHLLILIGYVDILNPTKLHVTKALN